MYSNTKYKINVAYVKVMQRLTVIKICFDVNNIHSKVLMKVSVTLSMYYIGRRWCGLCVCCGGSHIQPW